jgi:methionyl-tRNA formyltransferase
VKTYLVAGRMPWNRRVFDEDVAPLPGRWEFIATPAELTADRLRALQPRYVFFMHWSWKVPDDICRDYECVNFHLTDVPYGRGGSPLQNLIQRGHHQSKLTALRMVDALDAGPVYAKEPLSLEGSAEEILIRQSRLSAVMIRDLIAREPMPVPQTGDPVVFARRKPAESQVPALTSLEQLHDFLRMLDGTGYPRAYIVHHGFRYEFSRANLYDGRVVADVSITRDATEEGTPGPAK